MEHTQGNRHDANWVFAFRKSRRGDTRFLSRFVDDHFFLLHPEFASLLDEGWLLNVVTGLRTAATGNDLIAGRGKTLFLDTPQGNAIVVRQCLRGGWMQRLTKELFFVNPFQTSKTLRPIEEIQILAELQEQGLSVPKPVAAVAQLLRGGLCYRGFVITETIPAAMNALEHPQAACEWLFTAGEQAREMVRLGVYHPDLHIGNVLATATGEVYIIDFDKARRIHSRESARVVIERLAQRMQRSLQKHSFPPEAAVAFYRGLGFKK